MIAYRRELKRLTIHKDAFLSANLTVIYSEKWLLTSQNYLSFKISWNYNTMLKDTLLNFTDIILSLERLPLLKK